MENRKLVISLIRDNLIQTRLLAGLEALGFCTLHYVPNLTESIMELMGVRVGDKDYAEYMNLFQQAERLDLTQQVNELDEMAAQIYEAIAAKKFGQDREV